MLYNIFFGEKDEHV
jgi:hypothetical protein